MENLIAAGRLLDAMGHGFLVQRGPLFVLARLNDIGVKVIKTVRHGGGEKHMITKADYEAALAAHRRTAGAWLEGIDPWHVPSATSKSDYLLAQAASLRYRAAFVISQLKKSDECVLIKASAYARRLRDMAALAEQQAMAYRAAG